MTGIFIVKALLASLAWMLGAVIYMHSNDKPVNSANLLVVFAPWVVWFLYIMLFWWG